MNAISVRGAKPIRPDQALAARDFREELANDHLTMGDAWTVMRSGNIYDTPEPDITNRRNEVSYRGIRARRRMARNRVLLQNSGTGVSDYGVLD